jgi:hypothetical protein
MQAAYSLALDATERKYMKRFLLPSLLLSIVFAAGCTTSPKIVGKWKVQPSNESENIDTVLIFKDGTVLVTGSSDDSSMAFTWSKVGDQFIIDLPNSQTPVVLPDKDLMLWKEDNNDVLVFHRES